MSFGFPTNNKPVINFDTSAKKMEFIKAAELSEKYWAENHFEQSLVKIRIALMIGKVIVQNQPEGPTKVNFAKKILELASREQARTKQYQQNKSIQNTNNANNTNNADVKGKQKNSQKDKMINSLSEAIVTSKPNVKWEDISGLQNAKNSLRETVIFPIYFPQFFVGERKPWKGILLYGPPGTGKTFLAKACATEADGTFFSVSSSDLISKYVGQSERLIRTLFQIARDKKPSIIFIDEVDSMCGKRSQGQGSESGNKVKTQFLVQMNGVKQDQQGLLVLGATNLPWQLDIAMIRRFERRIFISLPQKEARYGMLKKGFKRNQNTLTDDQLQYCAQRTEGFSGADISILVKDTVYQPIRKLQTAKKFKKLPTGKLLPVSEQQCGLDIIEGTWMTVPRQNIELPIVTYQDLEAVLKKAKPSVDKSQLKQYEDWTNQLGQMG